MFDVSVINLKRAEFRRGLSMGLLVSSGFPLGDIYIHEARDGDDYVDTLSLCEDAIRAGYSLFRHSLFDGSYKRMNVNVAALTWSWYEICKRVVERDVSTLILHDDMRLNVSYDFMVDLVKSVGNYDSDWKFVNLGGCYVWSGSDEAHREKLIRAFDVEDVELVVGMGSAADVAGLISPAGARWMLEEMYPSSYVDVKSMNPKVWVPRDFHEYWNSPETYFLYLSCYLDNASFIGGLYSTLYPCAGFALPHSYMGSYIHSVDVLLERGAWVWLRAPVERDLYKHSL